MSASTAPTKVHELKTWPIAFQAIVDGRKRHEVRVNDRDFKEGDELLLREFNDGKCAMNLFAARGYTGREQRVRVTYITPGGAWGLPPNICVMSIELIT